MALLVIFGLIAVALLVRFLGHLLSDGWSAASTEVPAGKVLIYIILGIAALLLGPLLMDHGHRTFGKIVIFCVASVAALTVIAAIPSCNNNMRRDPQF